MLIVILITILSQPLFYMCGKYRDICENREKPASVTRMHFDRYNTVSIYAVCSENKEINRQCILAQGNHFRKNKKRVFKK